jgi:hypothetical protein
VCCADLEAFTARLVKTTTTAALALTLAALAGGYVVWSGHGDAQSRQELLALYAELNAETSPDALRARVNRADTLFLNDAAHPTHVMTPLTRDARNWNIILEYKGDRLCRARIGIYDDGSRPSGAPADRAFGCSN